MCNARSATQNHTRPPPFCQSRREPASRNPLSEPLWTPVLLPQAIFTLYANNLQRETIFSESVSE